MRYALLLSLIPLPAAAWEFSPEPICTLGHSNDRGQMVVTYDASLPEYTISVTTDAFAWPDGIFYMGFEGPNPLTISTDRQSVSEDGRTLTVRDTGFGNVLNGLEFNETAYAGVGQSDVAVSLAGIGPAMAAFRACPSDVPPTS